ncbi:hypothetical protein SAMN04487914_10876 [Arthrobacter sp. ok909]|uniref:hypothetical protein n=1 Tax=Arthrobacter sp. ok909 TaxID=1761746 RepID=UPI000881E584|nr:hypothetical protein [Arthrobacter sp. ok909]SDP32980.1 hypothetical protein SAMN04487914_10876 [Arthrobacter sp. ok909]
MNKRIIVDTDNGPALIEQIEGTTLQVIGATAVSEISADDNTWSSLHKKLKTGKLDFATVKKEHDISRNQN